MPYGIPKSSMSIILERFPTSCNKYKTSAYKTSFNFNNLFQKLYEMEYALNLFFSNSKWIAFHFDFILEFHFSH
jgi:hypothetical protein